MKDRQGNELSFEKAVDGIKGNQTESAIAKAKEMGYDVDINKGTITKQSKKNDLSKVLKKTTASVSFPNILNLFTSNNYQDSQNKNLQAVLDHSGKLNNNYEYTYLDRDKNKVYWITNGKIVDSAGIVSGVNDKHDGYTPLAKDDKGRPLYDRSLNLSSTPAGVFVLSKPFSGDDYKKGTFSYHLVEARGNKLFGDGETTNVAFHYAPPSRKSQMAQGLRKLSFGCVYGDCDESQRKIDKHIEQGDTVYNQPVEKGNYLYENKGKIKPHYVSTSPYAEGTTWGSKYKLNNVKYNTGY